VKITPRASSASSQAPANMAADGKGAGRRQRATAAIAAAR
jgi:hypothetical protein